MLIHCIDMTLTENSQKNAKWSIGQACICVSTAPILCRGACDVNSLMQPKLSINFNMIDVYVMVNVGYRCNIRRKIISIRF